MVGDKKKCKNKKSENKPNENRKIKDYIKDSREQDRWREYNMALICFRDP